MRGSPCGAEDKSFILHMLFPQLPTLLSFKCCSFKPSCFQGSPFGFSFLPTKRLFHSLQSNLLPFGTVQIFPGKCDSDPHPSSRFSGYPSLSAMLSQLQCPSQGNQCLDLKRQTNHTVTPLHLDTSVLFCPNTFA